MPAQWRTMTNVELVTAADVGLMQGLAQRVTATRPDLVNRDASFGELTGIWGKGHASAGQVGLIAARRPSLRGELIGGAPGCQRCA